MILLSYLGAHWLLFIIVVLATVVLGAAAWFLKNWKLAAAAIVLVIAGLAYQAADMEGYKRKVSEDSAAQVLALSKRLLAVNMAAALDAQRATSDAYLNSKLDALSRETPHNDSTCLDLAATRRVRAITGGISLKPSPARRLTGLLPGRSEAP
jgi:signal transduction histidine kinase